MKTPIRIIKRDERKVTHDKEISSARRDRQRTSEVIVKSWIIESRERRRVASNLLQTAFLQKELEAVTRG